MVTILYVIHCFSRDIFSIILVYITPSNRKAINILFSGLLISISFYILPNCIARFPIDFPRVYLFANIFIYTFTPIFYLLLNILFDDSFKFHKKHIIYIIPVLVYLIFLLKYLSMTDALIIERLKLGNLTDLQLIDLFTFIFNLYIIYKSWILFKRYRTQLLSPQKGAVVVFIGFILLINLLWINKVLLHLGNIGFQMNLTHDSIYWVSFSLLIFFPLTFLIIRSNFFKEYILTKTFEGYKVDNLELSKVESTLIRIMKEQKPYLDPEFSLSDLATLSGIKQYHLSRVMNHFMKTTFFNLINSYRLNEFLVLVNLKEYKNISLIDIAYESGFKSKSTFYKIFKENKGQSPKDYLKSIDSPYYKS